MRSSPMLKCSRERCVCAPHNLSAGTSTVPRLSVSMRMLVIGACLVMWGGHTLPSGRLSTVFTAHTSGSGAVAVQPETRLQLAPPECRERELAAVEILYQPGIFQHHLQDGATQRAADMRPTLTPIDAGIGEATAQ